MRIQDSRSIVDKQTIHFDKFTCCKETIQIVVKSWDKSQQVSLFLCTFSFLHIYRIDLCTLNASTATVLLPYCVPRNIFIHMHTLVILSSMYKYIFRSFYVLLYSVEKRKIFLTYLSKSLLRYTTYTVRYTLHAV